MNFITLAAATCMCASAAFAEPLTSQDQAYVEASVARVVVLDKCPQYSAVTNSLQTFADNIGVDSDVIGPAVWNAMQMRAGMDYDRARLIPEVTRVLKADNDSLNSELSQGQAKFCNKWGGILAGRGLVIDKKAS